MKYDYAADPVYQHVCRIAHKDPAKYLYQDPYHRYTRILEYLEKKKLIGQGSVCLDLGCLRPELASMLIRLYNAKVTGIDQWFMMEEYGKYVDMEFHCVDMGKDDFTKLLTKKYDIVFALEILEHMIDTDLFLEHIKSCMTDDGVAVISTPNINCLRNRVIVPLGMYPAAMEYYNKIHHVRLYNVPMLKKHLTEHGFEILDIFGVNFLPYRLNMNFTPYRKLSEWLGDMFPTLCLGVTAIIKKKKV